MAIPPEEARAYRVFGHRLRTAYRFSTPLVEAPAKIPVKTVEGPELTFSLVDEAPVDTRELETCLDVPFSPNYPARFQLLRGAGLDLVRRTDAVEIYVREKGIEARLFDPERAYLLDIGFFGMALPLWLERRGHFPLHASAVALEGRAVGFLASSAGGKSSLVAAHVQAGFPLLTDDALIVRESGTGEWTARSSYPQMRFWPPDARRLLGSTEGLERSHPSVEKLRVPVGPDGFGSFHEGDLPLAALYLPERVEGGASVEVHPVSPAESVVELLRQATLSEVAGALGLTAHRFEQASRLAVSVPVRRLRFPGGFENLERVVEAIRLDLAQS